MEQVWRVNSPDVISETIDGETMILHLGNGFYFSAGGSGALMWKLVSQSVPLSRTAAAVSREYGVDIAQADDAVATFVAELQAEGLVVPGAEPAADGAEGGAVNGGGTAWQPPTLSKFTDMEDLLLLDPVHEVDPQQGWPYAAAAGEGAA